MVAQEMENLISSLWAEIELGDEEVLLDIPNKQAIEEFRQAPPKPIPTGPTSAALNLEIKETKTPSLLDELDAFKRIGEKHQIPLSYPAIQKAQNLDELNGMLRDSHLYKIGGKHAEYLSGKGNSTRPNLFLVGLRPNLEDMELRTPFSGKQGELLSNMLQKMLGVEKQLCYSTTFYKNAQKAFVPPKDRQFLLKAMMREIELLEPKMVLVLGADLGQIVFRETGFEADLMGKNFVLGKAPAFITFHPQTLIDQPAFRRATVPLFERIKSQLYS